MNTKVHQMVFKIIDGVIPKDCIMGKPPRSQLFLVLDDHTSYEFYSSVSIETTSGDDKLSSIMFASI